MSAAEALMARFRAKVLVDASTGCHVWQGAKQARGYGSFGTGDGRTSLAHRWAKEQALGEPVPADLVVHHRCYNRACVNPEHLEVRTGVENVLDADSSSPSAVNSRRTHCVHGHPLEGENVFLKADGRRQCRTCHRAMNRESYRKRAAAQRGAR